MHKELLLKAFKKAKQITGSEKITHISNHLSDFIFNDTRETYGEKILRINYNKAKKNKDVKIHLKSHAADALSHYLDYEDYASFLIDNPQEKNVNFSKNKKIKSSIKKNKITITIVFILIASFLIYDFATRQRWMVWQEDHYFEVKFDAEKYDLNQIKRYKEDRILHFRKVEVTCDTVFFNKDESVKFWYGKNTNKELEYFTSLGLHPETGKTLKPITQYMINKYICD